MAHNRPQHILELSSEQQRRFLDSFDHVYSDIDGVVYSMETNVPNGSQAYKALESAGKQITFVTNNSVRTVNGTVKRLGQANLQVQPHQIWHPAQTLVYYLQSIKFDGLIYTMASPQFKTVLRNAGYQLIDGPNHFIEDTYEDLLLHIFDKQPVKAVVIDLDFNMTATKLLRAQFYLRQPDCLFLIGATDRLLPIGKGIKLIGPGNFASILVEASGKEATVMGKPGRVLGDMLNRKHNVSDPSRVLMIGDMLAQDVHFGQLCGFQTLLVLSGGCTLDQLHAETCPQHLPNYYADSVADFIQLFANVATKAHF
ncbi:GH12276 [Drosophila grimshawi]|uniref:GH12276 n=1 Tax=Drosophila grimshawi TaxID=7222 RepID=B4JJD8_DROGR|nr:GH12276 [Drosophila grimshawi]